MYHQLEKLILCVLKNLFNILISKSIYFDVDTPVGNTSWFSELAYFITLEWNVIFQMLN